MIPQEALLAAKGEQVIKTCLKRLELGSFDSDHGSDFTVSLQTFLISHRQASDADTTQENQANLCSQCDQAALQLLTIQALLDQRCTIGGSKGLERPTRPTFRRPLLNGMAGLYRRRGHRGTSDVRL